MLYLFSWISCNAFVILSSFSRWNTFFRCFVPEIFLFLFCFLSFFFVQVLVYSFWSLMNKVCTRKERKFSSFFFFEENFLLSFFPSNFWWEFERVLFLKSEFYLIFLNHKWHFFLHQVFFQEYDKHMLPTPPHSSGVFLFTGGKKRGSKKEW